jgi:hypothetical protein
MKMGWVCVAVVLTACSSPASETAAETKAVLAEASTAPTPPEAPAPAPKAEKSELLLAPGGLSIVERPSGKASLIKFGIPRASAELMIGNVQGDQQGKGSSSECGAGTVDYTSYKDDLQLTFQDGKFVGWATNGAKSPLRTAKGIGVGSTRRELDAAYKILVEDSSLGLLWSTGDMVGTLDIDGIDGLVDNIWAGTVCLID